MSMDDIGFLLHVLDMDSFTILVENFYVMDLYDIVIIDLFCDLDIVVDLVFINEDLIMVVSNDKL